MYMTDFNKPCLKDADSVTKGLKEIYYDKRFLKIMQKEISKVGKHHQLPLPLRNNNNSRALHIEITHSLNSDSFIQALRPVFTCRGNIKVLYSDNGTNFVRCKNELKKAYKEIYNERILSLMQSLEETQWICTKYKVQDWKTRNYEGNRILERRVKNCAAY